MLYHYKVVGAWYEQYYLQVTIFGIKVLYPITGELKKQISKYRPLERQPLLKVSPRPSLTIIGYMDHQTDALSRLRLDLTEMHVYAFCGVKVVTEPAISSTV